MTVDWYEIQYAVNDNCSQALNLSAISSQTVNATGNSTKLTLENLQKWTCYEVHIRATLINGSGYTNFSASERNRTLEDGKPSQK